jgi:hypothetical protein
MGAKSKPPVPKSQIDGDMHSLQNCCCILIILGVIMMEIAIKLLVFKEFLWR